MRLCNEAVGEVVSTLLTLMIVLGVVAALLIWGIPYLEEREIQGESQTVYGGFDVMYDTMSGLIFDGYGSKGYCNIVSTNKLASLNIDSQDKKLILMYTFPGLDNGHSSPGDYDFNVSGLDDEDDSFSIETYNLNLDLQNVKIYWLDPGQTQQFTYETAPYKNIYQNYWSVQSFTTPIDRELDKVKIYVMKRGVVSSNLNVSIYPDNGGTPNFNNTLASYVIQAADITSSFEWIECNIPDRLLTAAATYYIGVNTSGGGFEDGVYNYYRWYLTKNSPYNSSSYYAYVTVDDGLSWTPLSGYDFEYRLIFSDNNPPNSPVFRIPNQLYRFSSGVEKPISVSATDDDPVRCRIFWGDGKYDESVDFIVSDSIETFLHTYTKPGTYTLTLQAIDEHGDIYNPDNITEIYVSTGDYLPDDRYYEESPAIVQNPGGPPYAWTITTQNNRPLNGTLRIDLFSTGDFNDIPFGRIWVFNLGYITYESPHTMGTQRTIFENGGILSFGPVSNGINSPPSFFEEDDAIGFRIIQIGKSYIRSVSGSGVYEIGLNMRNSYSREPRVTEPESKYARIYNLKIQINDSFADASRLWINYFTTSYNFGEWPDRPNTIYYKEEGKYFVLDSSFIEVNVEGLR